MGTLRGTSPEDPVGRCIVAAYAAIEQAEEAAEWLERPEASGGDPDAGGFAELQQRACELGLTQLEKAAGRAQHCLQQLALLPSIHHEGMLGGLQVQLLCMRQILATIVLTGHEPCRRNAARNTGRRVVTCVEGVRPNDETRPALEISRALRSILDD